MSVVGPVLRLAVVLLLAAVAIHYAWVLLAPVLVPLGIVMAVVMAIYVLLQRR